MMMHQLLRMMPTKLLLVFALFINFNQSNAGQHSVIIDGGNIVHSVDERFVSFTIDAGEMAAGYAVNDLTSKNMIILTKALTPAYLRLSGGSADSIGYNVTTETTANSMKLTTIQHCVGSDCGNCDLSNSLKTPPVDKMPSKMSAYFNLSTWTRINKFAASTNSEIIFGLNSKAREYTNTSWDGRYGMMDLIQWTHKQSFAEFPVIGYELGNEPDLFCRGNETILPKTMVMDVIQLRKTLDNLPLNSKRKKKYLLLGPDTAGIGIVTGSCTGNPQAIYNHFYKQFVGNLTKNVDTTKEKVLDEITFHQYYFKGPGGHADQFIDVTVLDTLLPKIQLAVGAGQTSLGETSSAYDGGTPSISSTFASTFSWLDKLGLSARFGLTRVFRQQLCCGASYDLLGKRGEQPRPDYWSTLLWKTLMSGRVLAVSDDNRKGREIRTYSHCSRSGGIVVMVINIQKSMPTSVDFSLQDGNTIGERMEVYTLSTVENVFTGSRSTLNGVELLFHDDKLPKMSPKIMKGNTLMIEPLTIAFVVFPEAKVNVCNIVV